MFGLNEITWSEFLRLMFFSLFAWYTFVIVWAWFKAKGQNKQSNFEDYHSEMDQEETLHPITVSSKNFPSQIIPVNPVVNIPLQASLYEENGYDEGVTIEHFIEEDSPMLAFMLSDIQCLQ